MRNRLLWLFFFPPTFRNELEQKKRVEAGAEAEVQKLVKAEVARRLPDVKAEVARQLEAARAAMTAEAKQQVEKERAALLEQARQKYAELEKQQEQVVGDLREQNRLKMELAQEKAQEHAKAQRQKVCACVIRACVHVRARVCACVCVEQCCFQLGAR